MITDFLDVGRGSFPGMAMIRKNGPLCLPENLVKLKSPNYSNITD